MSFFEELKHRNVFRVAMAYAIGSWLIAQIADLVLDSTDAPGEDFRPESRIAYLGHGISRYNQKDS